MSGPREKGPYIARQRQQPEVERMLELLRQKIFHSAKSQLEIEKKLGMSCGHLSNLLSGHVEMSLYMLLAILDCADIAADEFFLELHPRYPHPILEDLAQKEARLRSQGKPGGAALARLYREGLTAYLELRASLARVEELLEPFHDTDQVPGKRDNDE